LVKVVFGLLVVVEKAVYVSELAAGPAQEVLIVERFGELEREFCVWKGIGRIVGCGGGAIVELPYDKRRAILSVGDLATALQVGPLIFEEGLAGPTATIVG
jgi:hypothetical protein